MVKKAKSSKPAKLKSSPTAKSSVIGAGISAGKQLLGFGGKSKGVKRSKKKSALWYAKEIQRMKLKRRYEKVKFGVMR
jgi:hypothetical protein